MQHLMKTLLVLAAAGIVSGCNAVQSTAPVGAEPAVLEVKDWEGTWWGGSDNLFVIKVLDAEKGIIQVGQVVDMEILLGEAYLLVYEDWMFVSVKEISESQEGNDGEDDVEKPEETLYKWARIRNDDGRIVFWQPSVPKFRSLVLEGILPGTARDRGNVILDELETSHLELISSREKGVLFEWEDPGVLIRLPQ